MCVSPQRQAIFRQQNVKKCSEDYSFFNILTFKCAFRHSGVQFFDIWTDKSAPKPSCCTFWLSNVLFATAACNFSTSEQTKVLRSRHVLYILTFKCAFRHSGVQFLMSPLSTYLRTRRFNRPTFGLTRHTNLWKNTALRDFSNIWRGCIFFLLTFWLLHLLSTDLTTLLLLFNSPYCRKFLFKLPSIIYSTLINNEGIHPWLHATSSWTMAFKSNQNPYDNVWPSVTPSSRWRPPYLLFVPAPPWRETPPRFTRGWWRYLQAGSMVMTTLVVPQTIANLHILLGRHDGMKSHVVSSACRWCPPSIFKISKKSRWCKQGSQMKCYRKIFQNIPKIPTIYTSF